MANVLGNNLRALRDREGITQQELAAIAQVTRETVNKWESGTIGNIRTTNLESILEHFGLTIDDLRSESRGLAAQLSSTPSPNRIQSRVPILQTEDFYGPREHLASQPPVANSERRRIPLLETVWQEHPNSFAIETSGPSMNRVLPEGCLAIVDPTMKPTSGSIALVRIDAGTTGSMEPHLLIRRLHLGSTMAMLSAETYDTSEDDILIPVDELDVIGIVIWYQPTSELG